MRLLIPALALALVAAAPAYADTLQEVTAKGIVLTVGGTDIDISFTPDGKFSGFNGAISGTWRIDGDKLCTKGDDGNETCMAYPAGKKSGDKFEVESPAGPIPVRIK